MTLNESSSEYRLTSYSQKIWQELDFVVIWRYTFYTKLQKYYVNDTCPQTVCTRFSFCIRKEAWGQIRHHASSYLMHAMFTIRRSYNRVYAYVQIPLSAPSGGPGGLTIHYSCTLLATAKLSWNPPQKDQQNGIITGYTVPVLGPCRSTHEFSTDTTSIVIPNLNPFTLYTFKVSAKTKAGSGPAASKQSKTPKGGETLIYDLIKILNFLNNHCRTKMPSCYKLDSFIYFICVNVISDNYCYLPSQ